MKRCLEGISRYGHVESNVVAGQASHSHQKSSANGLSPAKSVFWTVRPNEACVSCFNEFNVATGLWMEKGGGYVVCVDCGKGMCFGCKHATNLRPGKVDCDVHGRGHNATQVCEGYEPA